MRRIGLLGGAAQVMLTEAWASAEVSALAPYSYSSLLWANLFGWIAFGKSSREVAQIMAISEHTVNDYIASVMTKLNASNRTDAVLRALLTNQIDLS